jgi:hypothetical protein
MKYNGVLRGIGSEAPLLQKTMIELCCSADVVERFLHGEITFKDASRNVNTYTTTLHVCRARVRDCCRSGCCCCLAVTASLASAHVSRV